MIQQQMPFDKTLILALTAILIYASVPTAVNLASLDSKTLGVLSLAHLTALLLQWAIISLLIRRTAFKLLKAISGSVGLVIAGGLFWAIAQAFYFYAFASQQPLTAIILAELYPIFLLLTAPFSKKQDWRKIDTEAIAIAIVSFFVAATIIYSTNMGPVGSPSAAFLAIGGAFFNAVNNIIFMRIRVRLAYFVGEDFKSNLSLVITEQACCRTVMILFLGIGVLLSDTSFPTSNLAIGLSIYIGVATGLIGSIAWQYALWTSPPAMANLWYFTPIISIFFGHIFLTEPITDIVGIGAVALVFINLSLQARSQITNARTGLALIFIVSLLLTHITNGYIAFNMSKEFLALLITAFAVLIGFSLTRIHERNRTNHELLMSISRHISSYYAQQRAKRKDHSLASIGYADKILRKIVEVEYSRESNPKQYIQQIDEGFDGLADEPAADSILCEEIRRRIYIWLSLRMERIDSIEYLLLTALAISLSVLSFGTEFDIRLIELISVILITSIFGLLFYLRELDVDSAIRNPQRGYLLQRSFESVDKTYYLPNHIIRSGLGPTALQGCTVRTELENGEIVTVKLERSTVGRNLVIMMFLVLAGVTFFSYIKSGSILVS